MARDEETHEIKARLKSFVSKKLFCALAATGISFFCFHRDWGLDVWEVITSIAPLIYYIGLEGLADIKKRDMEISKK